jgi:hypothetical protein
MALPNLERLMITELWEDTDEDLDYSLLSKLNFPKLVELGLDTFASMAAFITEPTVKLPKLKILDLGKISEPGPGQKLPFENLFSSPLLHELTTLRLPGELFKLASLTILCNHAQKFINLEDLVVHTHNMKAIERIASSGKKGGFPNLKQIDLTDVAISTSCSSTKPFNKDKIGDCLRKVWPNIKYECYFADVGPEYLQYTPPGAFGWHPPRDYWGEE